MFSFNSYPYIESPKSIASLLNKPFTKVWVKMLTDKLFQKSSTSTIYKFHAASVHLLKYFFDICF